MEARTFISAPAHFSRTSLSTPNPISISTNDCLAAPDSVNTMQAPGSPAIKRWHDGLEEHDTLWLKTAQRIIAQLEPVHLPSSDTTHSTVESADAADRALGDAQAAHRAWLEAEEDAIEHAKQALRNAHAVDDEAMNAARRALRQQRNSLLPVARLPTEILRTIFGFCAEIDRPDIEEQLVAQIGWIAVTHVCQRWRDVALEHPGLWANNISYAFGPVWADAFAERAQAMPLVVHFNDPNACDDWHLVFLANNISRTAYLDLEVESSDDTSAFSEGALLLHTLKLTVSVSAPLSYDFPNIWHAPALRNVYFSTYYDVETLVPLIFLISARLTSLHIVVNGYRPEAYAFDELLRELLDALEGMHELEQLKIHFFDENKKTFAAEGQVRRRKHRRVTLANLAYLELTTYLQEITVLLSHLSLPAHTVACYNVKNPPEPLSRRFFPRILASVHCHAESAAQSSNAVTSLHIGNANHGRNAVITARTDVRTHKPTLTVRFLEETWPARIALHLLASAHLTELTLDCDVLKDCTWPDMPALRRIVVKGAAAMALCANLDRRPLCVPALAELVIMDVCISAEQGSGGTEGETMWLLPLILAVRAKAGCRLEELDVAQCDVDATWVLRAQVLLPGTLVWASSDEDP